MIGMVLLPKEGEVTGLICTGGSDVVEKGEGYDDASWNKSDIGFNLLSKWCWQWCREKNI